MELWWTGRVETLVQRVWGKAEDAELRRLHAQGLPLNQIHKRMGWSTATISKYAKKANLSFNREQMAAAIEANAIDAKARWSTLRDRLLTRAEKLLDKVEAPEDGGTFRTLVPVGQGAQVPQNLDFVPTPDERNISNAMASYMNQASSIEKMLNDGGMAEARGMVNSILSAIQARVSGVERMNPSTPAVAKAS